MKRRSKLIFSLISLCFSIAVLCFGVYSALSVSYSISGSVSYEIQDVFVELDLSVYRALSTTPVNSATHNQNVSTIKGAGKNISETDFGKLSYTDHESTYEKGEVKPGNKDGIFEADSPNLALTYGSPTNDNQGYAFYIVIDIRNLGSEIINAQITTAPTSLENTILRDSGNVEITAGGTERIVLGLALDDVTKGIISAGFTYTITISRGELPAEPITDMMFFVDEATKTATLESYTGSGGNVVIPESIGYDIVSSKTLTFKTMEDMSSDPMNEFYFCQDLYITLPNQEAQLIENAYLWRNEKMESIQAKPEDYFQMTIQTVESYEINQEDYNQYATLNQEMPMMVTIMPMQMIMGGLCNSVYVQYGTEGQSFTFNMENYNAAMAGDNSPTSEAIRDFMSKVEDPNSLLPVTYSNFGYGLAVKGEEYFVTSIGERTFENCDNLTSIEMPSSVTSIGSSAFSGCSALKTVTFGANSQLESIGSNAFYNCDALETVTFGTNSQLASIGSYAFYNCSKLTSIEIPSGVASIGDRAFSGCSALKTVTFGDSSQLASIGSYAFYNCSKLTSIKIPSSVTSIGSAFSNCSALATVTFGENSKLESIGSYTFSSCSSLISIDIPSRVTSIGSSAFRDCSNLNSIEIPSRVTSIGDRAFSDCSALKTVAFGESSQLVSIGEDAFYNCSNLTSIEIPSSVTSIRDSAFYNCDALEKVNITDIDAWAMIDFDGYVSTSNPLEYGAGLYLNGELVTEVTLTTATKINDYAFYGYDLLTSITIPSSVTSIGDSAFSGCWALAEVYNYSTHIPRVTIGNLNASINGSLGYGAKVVYNPSDLTGEKPATRIQTIGNVQYYVYGEDFIAIAPSVARGSLTTLTLDSKTTEINQRAFRDCSSLTSIEILSRVTSIGKDAFYNCYALTSIEIPSSVTSIGDYAFSYCYALAEVYNYSTHIPEVAIGNSYSTNGSLGEYAKVVYNPSDLTGEKPATRIQTIGNVQYYIDGEDFIALAPSVARGSLTTLTLDSKTTKINAYAFINCFALTSIEISSRVTSIGDRAFSGCSALETVTFGDSSQLASIGFYAFYNCSKLTSIEIPISVTSIGGRAFSFCSALEIVTFKDTTTEWTVTRISTSNTITSHDLLSPSTMATYLTDTYNDCTWTKKQ